MHQEGFELRWSHKQKWGRWSPGPPPTAQYLYWPWKSATQFKHSFQHVTVTAPNKHSRSTSSQARSALQDTDNTLWPRCKYYLGQLFELWVGKNAVASYKQGFCTHGYFQSFYCSSKWPAEKSAAFSGRGCARILSVSAMCSTIEPLWCSPENLFMDLDFEHSFHSLSSFTIVFEPLR